MTFNLPWPPSNNTYWRHPAGKHLISAEGRAYRKTVWALTRGYATLARPVAIDIKLKAPDRRRRDLDNLPKAILDALVFARVLEDDSLVHGLSISWLKENGEIVRCDGGEVMVGIYQ